MREHGVITLGPRRTLVGSVPPSRFLGWCERLTTLMVTGRADRADALLALLARSWGLAYATEAVDRRAWDAALAEADAFAVAHLLDRSALPARPLADLVDRVLVAWCFGEAPCTIERHAPAGQRTPEVLLGALARDPDAARRLLAEWEDDALDLLIGWEPDAVGPLLVAASTGDPDADTAETGRLVGKVLEYLWANQEVAGRAGPSGSRLIDWLGALVGPWQLHLLARSPGWAWPALDTAAVVRWIASSRPSADALAVTWAERLG
jgi:hypothetical protein